MDCPSEENLIRLKLDGIKEILRLEFDIENRKLTVYHNNSPELIGRLINELNLDSNVLSTEVYTKKVNSEEITQRKVLWAVLIINFAFFLIEIVFGFISNSMGLVADSLDMLADAFVYGISLYAVGGTIQRKKNIAKLAGYFQITLAVIGFVEVLRRFIGVESLPDFRTMIIVSFFALIANSICLYLLQKSKSKEAHMRASMIFTSNDVIINLGVIVAGTLVLLLNSGLPDLIIGSVVFIIVINGAIRIMKLSK
ncbi:MAG: cation transporter [Ignavibacterium sp.]|jgi:Co/Zn/Cd efflux system component|nr:cation transporter [Ignavibacterium album]MCA2004782.1 cation transporter [Ignavibacterium sp.]MCX8106638.1 cation transporter [Ignavibacterium album]